MNSLKNKIFISVLLFFVFFSCGEKVNAATLFIQPSQTEVTVGNIVNVQVSVDTIGKVINNAESILQFPKDLLEVVSLSKQASIFSLWVEEPAFSNNIGQINFNGGVPNPGFQGGNGKIVSITFRAKKSGTASIIFLNGAVRENDGLGTDILSNQRNATIRIIDPEPRLPVSETSKGSILKSKTHPDQQKWYTNNEPEFYWDLPEGALEVRMLIGENPSSVPSVSYTPPISKRKVDELPDGTYYFSLQVRTADGWSSISRYRVNIDTTPPKSFSITFPNGNKGLDTQPAVFFTTTDNTSGISHYEIVIGTEGKPLRVTPQASTDPYILPEQKPGEYALFVTAVDKAGNTRKSSAEYIIEGIKPPTITYYPETMEEGDILKIRGTTYPNSNVTIYVREGNTLIFEENTQSNNLGDFVMVTDRDLNSGVYTFTAHVRDDKGAQSLETSPLTISVRSEFVTTILGFILKYLSGAILIILAIGAIIWLCIFLWFRIRRTIALMRREAREAEKITERAFKILREDVVRHIVRLKKADRKLTKEEMVFLEEFEEKLGQAEGAITKEIKDVLEV